MDTARRSEVRRRAGDRCEYCLLDQRHCSLRHHMEHIVAKQHGGGDGLDNLALACHRCNLRKGPNLSGVDPVTGELVPLFHPRRDGWTEHFGFDGAIVMGLTATGRATVQVLDINEVRRIELRTELFATPQPNPGEPW